MKTPFESVLVLLKALSYLKIPPKEGIMLLAINKDTDTQNLIAKTGCSKRDIYQRAQILKKKGLIANHLTIHQTTSYSLTKKGREHVAYITLQLNEHL